MPDITMCMDMTCSQKETCYRYKAKPNEYRQSYFVGSPRPDDGGECNYYWKDLYEKQRCGQINQSDDREQERKDER